ncbi:MAG: flagellar motor switch protein FliM [bacterium]|nr:flagellar motor switch protein FliM [bacterium]
MNKILSQEEIDALLQNVSKGKSIDVVTKSEKKISLYDFKHPDRISKEQTRSLRSIHDNFARLFATFLSTSLRTLVDVNMLSIDQVTYSEYTMSLSVPSALYVLSLKNIEGKALLEISPQFLLFVVDRLLGGQGETDIESREITAIEQTVCKRVINNAVATLNDVWMQIVDLGVDYESFETDPQFVQIARGSETIAIVFFEIRMRGTTFTMNFGYPYYILEPLLQRLSSQSMIQQGKRKPTEEDIQSLRDRVVTSRIPITVQLARTKISVNDFIDFKEGDVLELEQPIHGELPVLVNGRLKFFSVPGTMGRKKAIRITRLLDPDEELIYE